MPEFPSTADLKKAVAILEADVARHEAALHMREVLHTYKAAASSYDEVQQDIVNATAAVASLRQEQTQVRLDTDEARTAFRHEIEAMAAEGDATLRTLTAQIEQASGVLDGMQAEIAGTQASLDKVKAEAQRQVEQAVLETKRLMERDLQELVAQKARAEQDVDGLRLQHAEMIQTIANVQQRYLEAQAQQKELAGLRGQIDAAKREREALMAEIARLKDEQAALA